MNLIAVFMNEIDNMRFADIDEAYDKKDLIREKYSKMTNDMKEMYKWYFFFQLCLLKNPLKSLMWDYICGYDSFLDLRAEYINFCKKRDRIKEYEI